MRSKDPRSLVGASYISTPIGGVIMISSKFVHRARKGNEGERGGGGNDRERETEGEKKIGRER